ncbi:MAG: hypothetical protein FD146_988 [Anaerolineaceae bacterium]|nr:MAG: hypothetical protein FD146_988 [Anaerolineaceae bacterium]
MGTTLFEVILGAVVAILITIWVENLRKPKLKLQIASPSDRAYQNHPARDVRFLGLELINKPLPRIARWMQRNAALQCHGTITFYHLDGQNVFGRAMSVRWSGSPEPVPTRVSIGNQHVIIVDPARFSLQARMDVYPGESERLDVAAKFDNDEDCYGWSNENYFSTPIWRHPNWQLPSGRYLVKVSVVSAGERCSSIFRLINDVVRQDFRLEKTLPGDKTFD